MTDIGSWRCDIVLGTGGGAGLEDVLRTGGGKGGQGYGCAGSLGMYRQPRYVALC